MILQRGGLFTILSMLTVVACFDPAPIPEVTYQGSTQESVVVIPTYREIVVVDTVEPVEYIPEVIIVKPVIVKPKPDKVLGFTTEYDYLFKKYSKEYLPQHSWYRLKAICTQESGLRPDVSSGVGAKGLCQFMDPTWDEVSGRLNFPEDSTAYNPELAVEASAFYMSQLITQWKWQRPDQDRINLAQASYNAGLGSILKAQAKCNDAVLYKDIIICLVDVTGEANSAETRHYVKNIQYYYDKFIYLE